MYKIYYSIKNTQASTDYLNIDKSDMDYLITMMLSIQCYMAELSLCQNVDVKELLKYYKSSNKTLPFHKLHKKHNSPQTYIAGILNNLMYGNQRELSLVQAQHLQNMLNNFVAIIELLVSDYKLDLQANTKLEIIHFTENIWTVQP